MSYSDVLRKHGLSPTSSKKKDENKSSTTSRIGVDAILKKHGISYDVDDNFINTFLTDANRFLSSAEDEYGKIGWGNASPAYESRKNTWSDLSSRSNTIRGWLYSNKSKINEDAYKGLFDTLNSFDNSASSIIKAFEGAKNHYSRWETEDDYIKGSTETAGDRQKRYEENLKKIEGLKAKRSQAAGTSVYNPDSNFMMPVFNPKVKQLDDEIKTLEAENLKYERGEDGYVSKAVDDHSKVTQKSDFATGSASRDYKNPSREEIELADAMNDSSTWHFDADGIYRDAFGNELAVDEARTWYNPASKQTKVEDKLALYLNTSEDERTQTAVQSDNYRDGIWKTVMVEGFNGAWEYLTEKEKDIYYYYLYESQERADKYLADMEVELNRRRTLDRNGQWSDAYDESNLLMKIAMNIATVPAKFASTVTGTIDNAVNTLTGNDINPYSMAHGGMHFGQTIRGATSEDLDATGIKIPVLDFTLGDLYQTGMSRLDSALATTIFGGGGTVFLGMGAAQEEAYRLYQQGASAEQITLGAFSAGAAEAVFEYVSFDKLVKMENPDTIWKWAKSALIQGGIEASEETFTEISNIITNAVIMGQQSDLAKLYEENGNDWSKTGLSLVKQVANSAFGGFIGGFGAGVTHGGKGYINAKAQYNDAGKTIMGAEGGVDALKNLANEVAGVSTEKMQNTINKQAGKVSSEIATGKGLGKIGAAIKNTSNATKVGRLYDTVQNANNLANTSANKADISKLLERKGFNSGTANDIAEVLVASYNGQELTKAQEKLLKSAKENSVVQDAISNIMVNEQSTMGQRSKNIRDFNAQVTDGAVAKDRVLNEELKTFAAKETPDITYEVSEEGKTIDKDGNPINIVGIESTKEGKLILKTEDGTIDSGDVQYASEADALVYETVAVMGVSVTDANEIISAYKSSDVAGDVYAKGIKDAYNYGVFGYRLDDLAKGTYTSKLTAAQRIKAFKLGRAKAGDTKSNNLAGKKGTNRKRGVVKGYDVTMKELNKSFNTTQRRAYKILDTLAEITGIDIVLYRSTSDADGNLHGGVVDGIDMSKAQGAFSWHNDKIYIDINAGVLKQAEMADAAKYSMLRTFGHEFTHFLEKHNPVEYENFRDLVFDVMRRNGQNPDAMIEAYMDQDSGLIRDKASREVVAEAMTDILPEASFVQELAEKHHNIFQMLLEKLKEFVTELKEHFRLLGLNRSVEAAAVKEHINGTLQYAEEIVQMFDRIAVQAVERYQTAQTAEKSTAAKSNGVQFEIKQIGDSGQFYVQADRQVLTGNDPDVWGKQIEQYINDVIRQQQDITIPTSDGHILLLTGRSSYKLSDRHISMIANKVAGFLSDEEFALKGRAATHIDELIQVARFDKYKADKDGKHQNDIGEDGFNTFVAHFRDFDGKYYRIPFTAGINSDEETAYSIGRIRQRSFPADRGSSPKSGRSKGGRKASGDIIYSSADQSQVKTAVQIAFENAQRKANDRKAQKQTRIPGDNGEVVDARQEVSYSLRRDAQLMDKAVSRNRAFGFVQSADLQKAKADREAVKAEMERLETESAVALPADVEGNTFVSNSYYDGTEENTTICPRSLAAEALVDAVSEYVGRPLTVQEQLDISQDLQGRTLMPEYLYCYVATDRKAYRAFLGDYVQQRDAVIEAYKNGNTDVSRYSKKYKAFLRGRSSTDSLLKGFNTIYRDADHQVYGSLYGKFLDGRKDTDNMWKRFNLWIDTYKSGKPMVQASHLANVSKLMGDIQNEFGHDLKAQIKDAMAYAQSASWAKKRVGYLAYNGHILKWKQQRIDRLNSHYGLRMYSFSDFSPAFILENMQMITDAAVRGLKMLSYSKEIDFVKIFASTGMNINVSTFGFERNGNVYENNVIGADWEQARKLRSKHPNVGITFVATNDTLVNWALDQDWIDVVIPYHLVRTGAVIAKALGYTNYTSESADRKTVDWTKGIDEASISPQMHNNDKSMYLAELERNHLRPRFVGWLSHPNYMKLVNETRQSATESRPVQPVFDLAAAKDSLAKLAVDGYYKPIGGTVDRMYEIAAEIGEKIEHGNAGDASLQRRTSTLTNRDLLAGATGTNEYERSKLKEYQKNLQNSREQTKKLADLEKELNQLKATKDSSSKKRIGFLRDEIIKTKNRIKIYDGILSRLEAKDLNGVVVREKNRVLDRLQTEYGTIPQGENPVREDALPRSTDGINRVSYTARTVKGAKVTPDAFAELIDTEVAKGNLTYIPITNDATTQKAVRYIQDEGWEAAKGSWSANVRAGKTGAEMAAVGALLLNNAARAGDKAAWLDILHDYQILGTNTAQGLQALRILKKLQPEDSLYMIRRSIRQMVEDMHLDTEVTLDPQLEAKYQNAKTDLERDAVLKEITKDVADQIPSTSLDKWTALRYVNMLGNLRTQIRNLTGNLGMKAVTSIKDSIATGLEQIVYLASGGKLQRTKAVIADKDLLKAAKGDFETVEAVILGGGKYSDSMEETTAFARAVQEQRTIFKFKPLEGYRKLTNWAMERGDLVFSKSAYAGALAKYLKAHGIKESDLSKVDPVLMDEARLYAVKEAQEATFRDTNVLSGWISKVGRRKDTPDAVKVISEGIMPFRKTPANVLVRAEEYSPLGVINSLVISIQKMRKDSDVTGAQVINSWAKTLTGTALFGLGMLLQNLGLLTGAGDDDEDKDQFESLNGWQNYAVVLPDGTNLTIDFLSPSAMPMFMGAQMMSLMHDGGVEAKEIEKALLSIADPMIQMSMLQGVNDTLENIQYSEDTLGQFLINACTSYLTQGLTNTLLGQMERSFENVRNSTYVDQDSAAPNWMQRQLGKASAKIPGWDFNQIPYINAWGEEEQYAGVPANVAYNLLSPSYVDKGVEDAVSLELVRLNDIQSDVNVFPQTPDKTISYEDKNGVVHDDYNLSAEEYVALARKQGQMQRKIMEKMLASKLYNSLPDQYKAKAVGFAYSYAREYAQINVLDRSGFSSDWMAEIQGDTAEGILNHVVKENIKGMLLAGDISANEAVDRRIRYFGDSRDEATQKVAYWNFQAAHPDYAGLPESAVKKYYDYAEPANISLEIYNAYYSRAKGLSKKSDIEKVIHSMNLTNKQKDALYRSNENWSEKKLSEAPWH